MGLSAEFEKDLFAEKLGDPDYSGEWEDFAGKKNKFSLYIRKKTPITEQNAASYEVDPSIKDAVAVDGTIFDESGDFAIFSGIRTDNSFNFTKTYTSFSRRIRNLGDVDYRGEINDGKVEGEYLLGMEGVSGDFEMSPPV